MKIRYLGLARQLAGSDEEVLTIQQSNSADGTTNSKHVLLEDVISQICKNHPGELSEAFASKGATSLGQFVLQVGDKAIRVKDSKKIEVNEEEISVIVVPTIVGG